MSQRVNIYNSEFQKAYNPIWRNGLKDKPEKIYINGKFLDIIHAMNKTQNILLLYKKKFAKLFYATIGLKPGDILSTIFFS